MNSTSISCLSTCMETCENIESQATACCWWQSKVCLIGARGWLEWEREIIVNGRVSYHPLNSSLLTWRRDWIFSRSSSHRGCLNVSSNWAFRMRATTCDRARDIYLLPVPTKRSAGLDRPFNGIVPSAIRTVNRRRVSAASSKIFYYLQQPVCAATV